MIAFVQRYALYGMGALLLAVSIYAGIQHLEARHWKKVAAQTQSAFDTTVANVRAASAKAIADNLADVRAKEGDAAALVENKQHDLEAQRAEAQSLAADYARRLRASSAANPGGAGQARIGEAPGTASPFGSAGGMSVLDEDDVRICTDNTVKALGWPEYYKPLRTRYNTDGTP